MAAHERSSHLIWCVCVCVVSVLFSVSVNPVSPAWRLRGRAYAASEASLGGRGARITADTGASVGKHTPRHGGLIIGVSVSIALLTVLCAWRRLRGKSSHRFEPENCRDIAGAPYRYISIMHWHEICYRSPSFTWWSPVRKAHRDYIFSIKILYYTSIDLSCLRFVQCTPLLRARRDATGAVFVTIAR